MFGLQIVKSNWNSLLSYADSVLEKYWMQPWETNNMAKKAWAITALQEMINRKSYFSVCTITNVCKLCEIHLSTDRSNYYSSLHCIDWWEMTKETKEMTIAMVLDDFRKILMYED